MNKEELTNRIKKTRELISANKIAGTFKSLAEIALEKKDFKLKDEVERLRDTYRYMATYLIDGVADTSRVEVYDDIKESVLTICDKLEIENKAKDSSDIFSETLRFVNLSNSSLSNLLDKFSALYSEYLLAQSVGNDTLEITKSLETLQIDLFNLVWVSFGDKKIASQTYDAIKSESTPEFLKFHLISALILSSLVNYDRYKFLALLDIYEAELSEKISARVLTGIIMILERYPERIKESLTITRRLEFISDSLISYRRIREIIMALIRTRDTKRISEKMQEEVIPELMKLRPDIMNKMKDMSAESLETGIMENNPEWEEMLEKSGLSEKIRELSDMQSEGADLMMVAFSNLKQFPFFNIVSNWFLPFSPSHSQIDAGDDERRILKEIMDIGKQICDSDKYSLAIALGKMPTQQKSLFVSQMEAQFSQLREEIKDKELKSSTPEFDEEVTKVVRDLYRFFNLFKKRHNIVNPFSSPFNFLEMPVLGEMMQDEEIVTLVGEFYFKRKFYPEALNLFHSLLEVNSEDAALWEKVGFCYQSLKFYEKSIEAFTRAELLKAPGKWLLKNLAFSYKKSGNFEKALEYYNRLLEKEPENLSLILNSGYCAMECGKIKEALQHYYHANYLDSENLNVFRAIAWGEFLNENFDKSIRFYDKIIASSPESSDFLNLGHLYLVAKDRRKAIENYKKAAKDDFDTFRSSFLSDMEILKKSGLNKKEIYIILDFLELEK